MSDEYHAARETLAWTHEKLARKIGTTERTAYRYASGDKIPPDRRRLLKILVLLKLTLSERKFEQIVSQL